MPTRDEYIAQARRAGEFLYNADIATPGSGTGYATSVLAYLALAELPEEEPEVEETSEEAAEEPVEEEKPAPKPKAAPKKAPAKKPAAKK